MTQELSLILLRQTVVNFSVHTLIVNPILIFPFFSPQEIKSLGNDPCHILPPIKFLKKFCGFDWDLSTVSVAVVLSKDNPWERECQKKLDFVTFMLPNEVIFQALKKQLHISNLYMQYRTFRPTVLMYPQSASTQGLPAFRSRLKSGSLLSK